MVVGDGFPVPPGAGRLWRGAGRPSQSAKGGLLLRGAGGVVRLGGYDNGFIIG